MQSGWGKHSYLRVLSLLKERHVLVLHCRGADGDIHRKEVHMSLLSIMLGVVSPESVSTYIVSKETWRFYVAS
ncbi:hypothetical protein DPMN_042624 [Dreissena polymorpha]|uniref:Uncharacterized protein n=1 Tax=Dreissena polymorpha TaxID=45954 RepID=A0A9D4D0Q6_DREPO|nr:hypothetical protein DPMN_042624 [Dreissena polymorpha]